MIHVRRDREDRTGALICPYAAWVELAQQALEDALREAADHEARREIYADNRVRAAREALFHDKCAYCESKITATSDWEVEHFRPKARVAERPDHPGYYWLAYRWSNLYPSCTLCNQRRKDRPRWGDCSHARTAGKADQFPLASEVRRAMTPEDDLAEEQPLLLDPCGEDHPELLLAYNGRGEVGAVGNDPRGEATIAIFHLDRRRLDALRRRVVEEVVEVLTFLDSAELTQEARRDFESWLKRFRLGDSCEYAAVARAVLRDPVAFGLSIEILEQIDLSIFNR